MSGPVPAELVGAWLERFGAAVAAADADGAAALFLEDGWWRDNLALTWDIRTMRGRAEIATLAGRHLAGSGLAIAGLAEGFEPRLVESGRRRWVEALFDLATREARGRGVVRLAPDDAGEWRAWTVLTAVDELVGLEERTTGWDVFETTEYTEPVPGRARWFEQRQAAVELREEEPTVLVVGAGHSGLGLAARLERLGIRTLVIDRFAQLGDNWRKRYANLQLHEPFFVDHFPYLRFPTSSAWPLMMPKDKLADWLTAYATLMDLRVWTGTEVLDGSYDEGAGEWTVRLRRGDRELTVHPHQVVMATGIATRPRMPEIPGMEDFAGEIVHSAAFADGRRYADRDVVVVGAGSSGHDIVQDLFEQGARPTMIQRSSTYVMSTEHGARLLNAPFAPGGEDPIEVLDLLIAAFPFPLNIELGREAAEDLAELDRELLDGLAAAGFALDPNGIAANSLVSGGGYYIDQGCSRLIIDGDVPVVNGSVEGFTRTHAVLADGRTIKADAVVLATGFENMREDARDLFGDEVADRCDPVWGIDAERNELGCVWRPAGQPGLWFHTGALQMGRYYSTLVALQIKALEAGVARRPLARSLEAS